MNLLAVNLWLAGIWDAHADHEAVVRWRAHADGPLVMCRVTQMALLRHLSDPAAGQAGRPGDAHFLGSRFSITHCSPRLKPALNAIRRPSG